MEVPRWWRLKLYNGISGEKCENCGAMVMARRRPVCECGLIAQPIGYEFAGKGFIASIHKVRGKNMRVYFLHEMPESEEPIEVTSLVKKRQLTEAV